MVALAERVRLIAAADVVMQALERQRHQHGAAVAVHNRFGQTGGAAGIDNPQRVIKRQPERLKRPCRLIVRSGCQSEINAVGDGVQRCQRQAQIVVHDQVRHRRQRRTQFGHDHRAVKIASAVGDAVTGNQHLGLDLLEAVQHRIDAHVRCANAPHAADAGGSQKRDHGLCNIRQIGRHAVARLHPMRLQMQRQRRDLTAQFGPAHVPRCLPPQALFVMADDGRKASGLGRIDMAQYLACIVELGADKPARLWHRRAVAHHAVRRRRAQVEVVPDALPEGM